jgi:hypothetical protein
MRAEEKHKPENFDGKTHWGSGVRFCEPEDVAVDAAFG